MSIVKKHKTGVINDPLGQTHSHAVANIVFCCFVLLDLKSGDVRMDGQNVQKQFPTGRDFGLAEWINILYIRRLFALQ